MKKAILLFGAIFTFAGVLALAEQAQTQPPAGQAGAGAPAQGRGRGNQPPPDPRDMGGGRCAQNPYNCADTPNPLPPATTVWLEEMTWMDVRDAIKAGKTSVIVPTGGIEPNGPWLVLGKHNYVLHANCDAIARKMGNALCAPIIKLVPEGNYEPKSGHMASPGTLTMKEETFRAVLEDVARSLKAHGFKQIFFIGDSGGNQDGQRAVSEKLNAEWSANPLVAHIQQVLRLQQRRPPHGRPGHQGRRERQHARRSDHHAQHVHRRSELGALRRACEGEEGVDQRG